MCCFSSLFFVLSHCNCGQFVENTAAFQQPNRESALFVVVVVVFDRSREEGPTKMERVGCFLLVAVVVALSSCGHAPVNAVGTFAKRASCLF